MPAEACQCRDYIVRRKQVSNRTEEALHNVVALLELKCSHVSHGEITGGVLGSRNLDKLGLEVDAINVEISG